MAISPSPFDRIQKTRRTTSRAWLIWVLVVGFFIAAALMLRGPAASALWQVVAPVARLREALGHSEAARLRAQVALLEAKLADRDALYKETLDLKERLGRSDTPVARVLAGVLLSPPWSPYDTLVVDAGEAQGIKVGDLVYAGGSALVGHITEVYATTARVELFSAPGATYQALLGGQIPIALEGQGGGSLRAEVPAGSQVKVGDTVELPGVWGGVAGKVSAIDARSGESFIVVYMQLPINPSSLSNLEIEPQ